jgi:hypothetical protein
VVGHPDPLIVGPPPSLRMSDEKDEQDAKAEADEKAS